MTIKEAIQGEIVFNIPERTIEKAAIDTGLNLSEIYTVEKKNQVLAASLIALKAVRGLKSIKEGEYTLTLEPEAIENRISGITGDLVEEETESSGIQDGTFLW